MAAVTFTSCLNDDDDEPALTPEEYQAAFQAIKGDYTGKLIYADPTTAGTTNKNDTLDVNWRIDTDSTVTVVNFPSAPLAAYITNTEISKLIAQQPAQEFKLLYGIYDNTPITFLINPKTITYDGLEYGGEKHKIEIAFYTFNNYSYGVYNKFSDSGEVEKTPTMYMQILVGGVYVDGKLNNDLLKKATALVFKGKK
jgi:hypothetical protein